MYLRVEVLFRLAALAWSTQSKQTIRIYRGEHTVLFCSRPWRSLLFPKQCVRNKGVSVLQDISPTLNTVQVVNHLFHQSINFHINPIYWSCLDHGRKEEKLCIQHAKRKTPTCQGKKRQRKKKSKFQQKMAKSSVRRGIRKTGEFISKLRNLSGYFILHHSTFRHLLLQHGFEPARFRIWGMQRQVPLFWNTSLGPTKVWLSTWNNDICGENLTSNMTWMVKFIAIWRMSLSIHW